jgi:hypothetical protein
MEVVTTVKTSNSTWKLFSNRFKLWHYLDPQVNFQKPAKISQLWNWITKKCRKTLLQMKIMMSTEAVKGANCHSRIKPISFLYLKNYTRTMVAHSF